MYFRQLIGAVILAMVLGSSHAEPPAPRVVLVRPSARQVPANLLRISIEFSAPSAGPVLPRIALWRADGQLIQAPFLQQELWSPDGKILTVILHPGRVKTGLDAREKMGPILEAGNEVTLALDGLPIKQWTVEPSDANGPIALAWKVSPVRVASKQPLVVVLDGPIDGRNTDYLAIADACDRKVDGHAQLKNGESIWTFTPTSPWQAGGYKLVVRGTLEDPAGNRLGGHFETPVDAHPRRATDAVIAFAADSTSSSIGSSPVDTKQVRCPKAVNQQFR